MIDSNIKIDTVSLNPEQNKAVTAPFGNMMVLAGAGSGKTRVLVMRVAWLIKCSHVEPYNILAVTFTNKAANEMQERIRGLVSFSRDMWIGTFHGICHRLLRCHFSEAGLPEAFQILDSNDQLRFIRRILKELKVDESRWSPKQVQSFINSKKSEGLRATKVVFSLANPFMEKMKMIYVAYEKACNQGGVVDFPELLLCCLELLQQHPEVLHHYRQRFQHILIDEFQDTSAIQYRLIHLLAFDNSSVMVVGDDDQSIYSWRGACVGNLARFKSEFANVETITLEQNYRSKANILNAANQLISHNDNRLAKKLWTEDNDGEPIIVYPAFNEIEEAHFIADRIRSTIEKGYGYDDIAILYRSNAQSRIIEETLIDATIPYRIYGGMRFFERAEIKDVLAYMQLIVNPDNDTAFERVVNFPARSIGIRTIAILRDYAGLHQLSLWQAAVAVTREATVLKSRANNALQGFISLMTELQKKQQLEPLLDKFVEDIFQATGLIKYYQGLNNEQGRTKIENLQELITATRQFQTKDSELSSLLAFLSHAALESGEGQNQDNQDTVKLMTLHSAKGLEFAIVFLTGLEENLFPHQMSIKEPNNLQEERRLCYVGITRAKEQLYLSYAERRHLFGEERYHLPSRFLRELPESCLQQVRVNNNKVRYSYYHPQTKQKTKRSMPSHSRKAITKSLDAAHESGFSVGQLVLHQKFGQGVILQFEGSGSRARIQIKFRNISFGTKWLMIAYANLTLIS